MAAEARGLAGQPHSRRRETKQEWGLMVASRPNCSEPLLAVQSHFLKIPYFSEMVPPTYGAFYI